MPMRPQLRTALVFVLGSAAFLAVPVLLSPDFLSGRPLWSVPGFRREMLTYLLLLGFFYLNYFVLVPRLYVTGRRWAYVGAVVAGCLLVVLPPVLAFTPVMPPPPMQHGPPIGHRGPPPGMHLRWAAFALIEFITVWLLSLHLQVSQRLKRAEEEQAKAKMSLLQAQINPHFLFNSLNSIYAMAIARSEATADAVVTLSGMMRYVLSEANRPMVPLEKEIDYLHAYISLQRLRLGDTLLLDYRQEGDPTGKEVAPMLLIPFIENAFKHGLNPEEDARIRIDIAVGDAELSLHVHNYKLRRSNLGEDERSGMGLENTLQRLRIQYPGRHKVRIDDRPQEFEIWLSIPL